MEEETFKKTLEEQQSKMLNRPDTPTSQISTESDEILFYKARKSKTKTTTRKTKKTTKKPTPNITKKSLRTRRSTIK